MSETSELFVQFDAIKEQANSRLEADEFWESLYHDPEYQGFVADTSPGTFAAGLVERLNENVIWRIVQMVHEKLAKQKPKPSVLTDGADWDLQQKAKKLDKFIWGTMTRLRAYEVQRESDLQMLLKGTGAIYVTSVDEEIVIESVPPTELFCEAASSRYGKPRTLYREQLVDRDTLAELYPGCEEKIRRAPVADRDDVAVAGGSYEHDMVSVVTCWKLPTSKKAKNGKLTVAIRGCVLLEKEWTRTRFPFAFSRFALAPKGFFGIGLVANLVGQQLELNRTLSTRQEALRLLGAAFVAVQRGSQVVKSHVQNKIGRIVEYSGALPQVIAPGTINPETFEHSDRVKSSMFSTAGVPELAASSMKPAGLNSGKALRTYADMQDEAIHGVLVRREQQIVDLAELILDEAEGIEERQKESESEDEIGVLYVGTLGTERIRFSDVAMDRNEFVMRVQPTSSLSMTLSGRLEDLMDMRELGLITDPAEMEELLQLPDLSTSTSRRNSMRELLLEVIEVEILGKGKAVIPEPSWDLQMTLRLAVQSRLRATLRGCPEAHIQRLREFEQKAIYYLNEANRTPEAPVDGAAAPPVEAGQPPMAEPIPGAMPGFEPPTPFWATPQPTPEMIPAT